MARIDRRLFLAGSAGCLAAATMDWPAYAGLGNFEPEATALFDRMEVRATSRRRAAINALIAALKRDDIWAALDGIYVLAAHTHQAALLNWRRTNAKLVAVNSPIFTVDKGFRGDGVTSYLTNMNSAVTSMQPSNLMLTMRLVANDGQGGGSAAVAMSNWSTYVNVPGAGGELNWCASSSTAQRTELGGGQLMTITRENRSAAYLYVDGGLVGRDSKQDSFCSPFGATEPLTILRRGNAYSTGSVSFVAYGESLSAKKVARLHAAVDTYMKAQSS